MNQVSLPGRLVIIEYFFMFQCSTSTSIDAKQIVVLVALLGSNTCTRKKCSHVRIIFIACECVQRKILNENDRLASFHNTLIHVYLGANPFKSKCTFVSFCSSWQRLLWSICKRVILCYPQTQSWIMHATYNYCSKVLIWD